MKFNKVVLLLGILSAFAVSAGASHVYPYCTKNADGSGSCSGSFEAFRKAADPNSYASFISYDNGYRYFIANFNGGVSYSCSPTYGTPSYALWPEAMNNSGAFFIQWNSAGTCTWLSLYNGSQYQSGW